MAKKSVKPRKRTGIFIYCDESFKKRIDRARKQTGRTLSGYVVYATLQQLDKDEASHRK